jgi:hypothetical protein
MRTIQILSVAALTMFTHMACVAPTATDENAGLSQDSLKDNGTEFTDGMTEADIPSNQSVATGQAVANGMVEVPNLTDEEKAVILAKYAAVQHAGIRNSLYEKAILYYDTNLERIPNKRWLSVIDFAPHSKNHRFFIMDMEGGDMASYPIAHGKKSDPNDDGVASAFSNEDGSNMSSVGYYLTAETYIGGNGRSLRLEGLSATNSNVRERLVVIHGAAYVSDSRPKQGRSLGCPAFDHAVAQGVIDQLKEGSLIFAMN